MPEPKKIAVLGAGFGGLRAAKVISRKLARLDLLDRYKVVLIDHNDHHTYTPLLYEVATTSKETATACKLHEIATYNITALLRNLPAAFIKNRIEHIDLEQSHIQFHGGESIRAEFVVIALGSEPNYFGIPGLKEHSLPFKTFVDAIHIRDAVWKLATEKSSAIRVVIGGAGSAGVELAAEFQNGFGTRDQVSAGQPAHSALSITLIEADQNILPGFDRGIIEAASVRLQSLGVHTITGRKISSAGPNAVTLENGERVPFDIFVWTGGVKAPSILSKTQLETGSRGRAVVGEGMECLPQTPHLKLSSHIYGLGDSVCFYDPVTKKPISGVARAAISQADIVSWNIIEEIKARERSGYAPRLKIYHPRDYPYIIPVGGKYALAKLGPFILKGFLGWILKGLVELNYLLSIMNPLRALRIWFTGLGIFIQNDRMG